MKKWYLKFASFEKPNDIFDLVKSGEKTIETRPVSPGSSKNPAIYQKGDILVLKSVDTGEIIEKVIDFVHIYPSIEAMASSESPSKILPGITSKQGIIDVFDVAKRKWGSSYAKKLETMESLLLG